ncbi:CdaR family protein [Saccharibacillus sp. JS10]|uniref:CdaR family protein n=1 Tax=Saccharibacillus sp. JS10 TaxID=2950552 RepID=UPI00210E0E97|nr:CdaR family protein [Saccharibacillus sp. JS10]MCQ4088663.1 CdaR family protein [Saccharibacillus sp. JS10]
MDKWLANNTAAKIIALAVALILWAMVHVDTDTPTITRSSQGDHTTIANVGIEPYGFDQDKYVLKTVSPKQVNVNVSGQVSQLTSLPSSSEYQVKMDLSNIEKPGQYTVPLKFDPPPGVSLLSIEPSKVTITVEEKVTKSFDAVVLTTGVPAEGFTKLDPIFEEGNTVQVTLPESEMEQVQKIQGEISVEGSNGDVAGRIKLVAYSQNGKVLDDAVIEPSSLRVQIPISSSDNVSSKTLPLNISYSGDLPDGMIVSDVQASAQKVTLYGSSEVLDQLSSFPPVTLNLDRVTAEGETTYTESLSPPEGIDRIVPASVNYKVTIVPYQKKTIADIPITLAGLANGSEATITNPQSGKMDITIVGASSLLDQVTADDIRLTADLTGLKAGAQDVKLKVDLPNYIRIEDNTSPTIKVQITGGESETGTQPPEENNPEVNPSSGTDTPSNGGNTETGNEPDSGSGSNSGSGSTPSDPPSSTDPPAQNGSDTETPGTEEEPSDTPSEGSTDNGQGQNPPGQSEGTNPDDNKPDSGTGTDTGGEAATP